MLQRLAGTMEWVLHYSSLFTLIFGIQTLAANERCKVSWKPKHEVTLGSNVTLQCTMSGENCFGILKWSGGPEKNVIVFDESIQLLDRAKYAVYRDTNGYYLTIKNLERKDLNVSYICHRGFDKFEDILREKYILPLIIKGKKELDSDIELFANISIIDSSFDSCGSWYRRPINGDTTQTIQIQHRFIRDKYGCTLILPKVQTVDLNMTYTCQLRSSVFSKDLFLSEFDQSSAKISEKNITLIISITIACLALSIIVICIVFIKGRKGAGVNRLYKNVPCMT